MAYEMKDGTGTIFPNKYHEEGDNKPHFKGELMWRGEKIEIALWPKVGQSGQEFQSAKLQEPRQIEPTAPPQIPRESIAQRATPKAPAGGNGRSTDMDEEIPFAPEFR